MIRFAYNPVSWDDGPIPGSMADRMVAPILEHLPAGRYDIDRYPAHGRLNAYLGMPGTYKGPMATREVAMTYRCLLNPDVEIPDDMIAAHWEWCLACSGRLPVPGTLRYELVRFGAAVNTAQVEMLRLASAAVRRLVEGLRRLADRDVARPVEDGIRSVGGDN